MLNVFPDLLTSYIFAPLMLRLTLGFLFIYISYFVIYKHRQEFFNYYKRHEFPFYNLLPWSFGGLFAVSGLFFVIGFLTQVVSLVSLYLLITLHLCDKEIKSFEFQKSFYLLLGIISVCLLFLGAGAFSVDLPL